MIYCIVSEAANGSKQMFRGFKPKKEDIKHVYADWGHEKVVVYDFLTKAVEDFTVLTTGNWNFPGNRIYVARLVPEEVGSRSAEAWA